jgi:hypothetical protein
MKGAPWARIWLTIVFSIRLAAAGILGVNSAFNENFTGFAYPLLAIILPIVVLYVMWGNERGDAFFSKK